MKPPAPSPLSPLRHPGFSASWINGTVAHSANWMQTIAAPILIFEMTDSSAWVGLAAVASAGPSLVASPLGGAWADRYSKRLILMLTLLVKVLVATSFYLLLGSPILTPYAIVGLLSVSGFASAMNIAAWQPFVAEIVPKRDLAPAYRFNAMQFNTSRAIGPALAGLVIAHYGMDAAFLVNACAYAPLAVTLLFVRPQRRSAPTREGLIQGLRDALRVLGADRGLWIPTLIVSVSSLFGQGLFQLMAPIAIDHFHSDNEGVGYLMSSIGVSSVVAAVLGIWIGERVKRSSQVRSGLVVYVVGLLLVAATHNFWVGVMGFALTGVAHVLVHVSATTALQLQVDDALRGRVTALYLMGIMIGNPLGAQIGGLVADASSIAVVITGAGLGLAVFLLLSQLLLQGFRDLDHVGLAG